MSEPRILRQQATIERIADFVLANGIPSGNLRALAAAAGTSDRMLLYYFRDKDELMAATLACLAARLLTLLDHAIDRGAKFDQAALLRQVSEAMRSPAGQPYIYIWFELVAGAARGREVYRDIGRRIAEGFIDWIASHLAIDDGPEVRAVAAHILATADGLAMIDALGLSSLSDSALGADRTPASRITPSRAPSSP